MGLCTPLSWPSLPRHVSNIARYPPWPPTSVVVRCLRLLQPQRITRGRPSGQPFAQQTLCLGVVPCAQVGLQQSIFKDFALGIASPYPNNLVRDRFEVLHRLLVVAACKRRECLDQSRHASPAGTLPCARRSRSWVVSCVSASRSPAAA